VRDAPGPTRFSARFRAANADPLRLKDLLGAVLAVSCGVMLTIDAVRNRRVSMPLVTNIGFCIVGWWLLASAGAERDRSAAREIIGALRVAARRGRPLNEALDALRFEADPETRRVAQSLRSVWAETGSLAQALERHPRCFEPGLRQGIAVAERTGRLSDLLVAWREESRVRERQVRHAWLAAAYPAILAVVVLGHRAGMHSMDRSSYLPPYEWIPGLSTPEDKALAHLPDALLLAFLVLILLGLLLCSLRRPLMGLVTHLPLAGPLCLLYAAADYARAVGGLIASGATVLQAHRAAAESQPVRFFRRRWEQVSPLMDDGLGFAEALERVRIPARWRARLVVAAAAKDPASALLRAGEGMAAEGDSRLTGLVRAIYPAGIVMFGVVVGAIAISFFTALAQARAFNLGH